MSNFTIAFTLIVLFFVFTGHAQGADLYADRIEVRRFIEAIASKYDYSRLELMDLFNQATKQSKALDAIQKPAEKKKRWYEYRATFITPQRIEEGRQFWRNNFELLNRVEEQYGVPPEIIIAIIGVETFYGKQTGQFPVFDSLVTLGFDYPPRSDFFLSELEHLLLLVKEEPLNISALKGSYAGAMGMSQFISSSYRKYAVDFDRDNRRDLWSSKDDIVASVANYFKEHGWQTDAPVVALAKVTGQKFSFLLIKGLEPNTKVSELSNYDVNLEATYSADSQVALVELEQAKDKEYWVAFNNFYVITRYNRSPMYAMAVYQLSEEIKQQFNQM